MPKLQLSFHKTFALKKEDLLKLLHLVAQEQELNDTLDNLSKKLGLGKPKVSAIKGWAIRSGLLQDDNLSPEAEIALNKDPYLESIVTDWVIHFYLSFGTRGLQKTPESPEDWGGWSYFIYSFLPENDNFTLDQLVQHSLPIFSKDSEKSLKENFNILLRTYTEKQALLGCHLLKKVNRFQFKQDQYDLSNPSLIYVIGYILAKLWERDYGEQNSVLTESILNQKMGFLQVLGIKKNEYQNIFKSLEESKIINQRSAKPYLLGSQPDNRNEEEYTQIIRLWNNPLDLLKKAYDEDRTMPNQPLSKVLDPFLDEDEGNLPCLEWNLNFFFMFPYTA